MLRSLRHAAQKNLPDSARKPTSKPQDARSSRGGTPNPGSIQPQAEPITGSKPEPITGSQPDSAMVQNQWYHFGVGAPPILVYLSGDWDVHWGYGVLTHGHLTCQILPGSAAKFFQRPPSGPEVNCRRRLERSRSASLRGVRRWSPSSSSGWPLLWITAKPKAGAGGSTDAKEV